MNHNQDKPEVITEEFTISQPYSQGHYYEHRASICDFFACGRELSLEESRRGKRCYRHYGGKPTAAMLMRLQEVMKDTDWESENPLPSCIENESLSHL